MSVLVAEGALDPVLTKEQLRTLQRLSRVGWLIYLARRRKSSATARERKLLEALKMEPIWTTVRGLVRKTPHGVRMLVVRVVPREVADNQALLRYLGDKATEVVKGVEISPEVLADSGRLIELIRALSGVGIECTLTVDGKTLDALAATAVEDGGLGPIPGDIFVDGARSYRVEIQPA